MGVHGKWNSLKYNGLISGVILYEARDKEFFLSTFL